MTDLSETTWDYIVVGAGSAGCVVANRLSEDPNVRVLLLEAGGSDRSLFIQMPAATYIRGIGNPRFDWMFRTEPDPAQDGRTETWPRGKVIGGSSSINGMLYVRGFPGDYDRWNAAGCAGWGWDDVLPLFLRHEDNDRHEGPYHRRGGELGVSSLNPPHPVAIEFLTAAAREGHDLTDDLNAPPYGGFGLVQATQRGGRRCSAARAFLDPVRRRHNLHIAKHAMVDRIEFEGRRASGVSGRHQGRRFTVRCAGEIIICAGAIASPAILLRSGIGPADDLQQLGLEVLVDRPDVGKNLQDHPGLGMTYGCSIRTFNAEMPLPRQAWNALRWLLFGTGPAATPDAHAIGFIRSGPEQAEPDIQVHVTPAGYRVAGEGELILRENSFTTVVSVCRPRSRGRVSLRASDLSTPPRIHWRPFADEDDLHRLSLGVREVKRLVHSRSLAHVVRSAIEPAWTDSVGDDDLRQYLLHHAGAIYHPAGTCRMGADEDSVVDPCLRVRGVTGLRVADASIMPTVVSGNLNAPCMMIGERAASFITS